MAKQHACRPPVPSRLFTYRRFALAFAEHRQGLEDLHHVHLAVLPLSQGLVDLGQQLLPHNRIVHLECCCLGCCCCCCRLLVGGWLWRVGCRDLGLLELLLH